MMNGPPFSLQRGGAAVAPRWLAQLTRVRLSQLASAPAQLELTWQGGPSDELPRFELGESLALGAAGRVFEGRVSAIEVSRQRGGQNRLHVRAYDGLDALRQTARAGVCDGAPFARLLAELCAPHAIVAEGFEGADVALGTASGRTDLELLRAASLQRGCYFQLDGQRLLGFRLRPTAPGSRKRWGDFASCRCESNARRAPGRVRVSGSTLAQAGSYAANAANELGAGAGDAGSAGAASEEHRLGVPLSSDAEAQSLAQALADRAWARALVFQGALMPGDLGLRPGSILELVDAPLPARPFVLTHVTHTYDAAAGGLLTELSSLPPLDEALEAAGRPPVLVGEVRELDDEGRVRVHFPTHDALSGWLRVIAPGAGGANGFSCLPDVGDAVVVLTPDGDPLHGVVLGGLWEHGPSDAGVASGRRRRVSLRLGPRHIDLDAEHDRIQIGNEAQAALKLSRQRVSLDAAGGTLALSNGRGSRLTLDGSSSTLTSATPLVIEAPGQSLTIRAASINFEQA
jgi:phage baseplate assembly protein gpV